MWGIKCMTIEQLERRMAVGDVFAAGQIINDLYESWDTLNSVEQKRLKEIEPVYQKFALALITRETSRYAYLGSHFQGAVGRA